MLKILYITRMNYFSNKSHVYTTAKTAEAMNAIDGVECVLASADNSLIKDETKNSFFDKLDIKPFDIISINSWSNFFKNSPNRLINWLETIMTDLSMVSFVFLQRKNFDVLYFRDQTLFLSVLLVRKFLKKPVFMELHAILNSRLKQNMTELLARRINGIVSISYGLKSYYDKYNDIGIVSFCSASNDKYFDKVTDSKDKLRDKYNLPKDKILIGYAGTLSYTGNYDSYGIEEIINALPYLDDRFVFVGIGKKNQNDTKHLEKLADDLGVSERVLFLPHVSKERVAGYILAFDILAHPSAGRRVGNSPAKLFEWLVSGRPIVAANTQAISEILTNQKNAILVDYKDPKSWSCAIENIVKNKELAHKLIKEAKETAKKHTWKKRGETIINFINDNR